MRKPSPEGWYLSVNCSLPVLAGFAPDNWIRAPNLVGRENRLAPVQDGINGARVGDAERKDLQASVKAFQKRGMFLQSHRVPPLGIRHKWGCMDRSVE
jgi:hypothetical protein